MQINDKQGFINGIKVLREMFGMPALSSGAVDQYWICLKDISIEQFTQSCRKLMARAKTDYGKSFPLPGDFLEAVQPQVQEYKTIGVSDVPGRTGRILAQLVSLMPVRGHFNTDEEADEMVKKMNAVIEEEFKDEPEVVYNCDRCHDEGYLHCWFQFDRASERVPNSPYWVTRCGQESPMPDLKLTPCITRCDCRAALRCEKFLPLYNSFRQSG
jgi:hypothetical protein